ncbi:MAG: hypothetical protein H6679_04065 [Epsilonproteobacteria bacterium]|nr:hypothetical protein [Campylobacterota bacterium]
MKVTEQEQSKQGTIFNGNILLFYAFDVSDDVDLEIIRRKLLLNVCIVPLSSYFKSYHMPLSFRMTEDQKVAGVDPALSATYLSCKVYNFGALSFAYRIPFSSTFEDLKLRIIDIKKTFDHKSDQDAKMVLQKILPAVKDPRFDGGSLKHSYFAVQVDPLEGKKYTSETFKESYGSKIASLLKLEIYSLSEYQTDQILSSSIGYYGQDFMIIDSEASFVYDYDYFEAVEFFEQINIQKLELQYYDRLLDNKLTFFYMQDVYTIPLRAYIPFIGAFADKPISNLAKLRVDISVITERLESSIKLTGDSYYINLYMMLVDKMALRSLRDSINRKLNIIHDLYSVYQNRLDLMHDHVLTLVIIILIAFEILVFVK